MAQTAKPRMMAREMMVTTGLKESKVQDLVPILVHRLLSFTKAQTENGPRPSQPGVFALCIPDGL